MTNDIRTMFAKFETAVQHTTGLRVNVPTHYLQAFVHAMQDSQSAARGWLDEYEPTPENQSCQCGGGSVCALHAAARIIRELAFLSPPAPYSPNDNIYDEEKENE